MKGEVREKIYFTEEEFEEFVEGETGFKIILDDLVDHRRWSVTYEMVIQRIEDDTYWRGVYERGATEYQSYSFDERWHGADERATFSQVFPEFVTKVIFS